MEIVFYFSNNLTLIDLLLQFGADINIKDGLGKISRKFLNKEILIKQFDFFVRSVR